MEIFAGSLKYDAKLCAFILKYIVWIENKHCKDMQVLDKWNSESLLYILYKDFPVSVVSISTFFSLVQCTKGQLISKRNSQAEDEFVFTSMRRVFVRFLGESSALKLTDL